MMNSDQGQSLDDGSVVVHHGGTVSDGSGGGLHNYRSGVDDWDRVDNWGSDSVDHGCGMDHVCGMNHGCGMDHRGGMYQSGTMVDNLAALGHSGLSGHDGDSVDNWSMDSSYHWGFVEEQAGCSGGAGQECGENNLWAI